MVALNASFILRDRYSARTVQARDFFLDAMSTVLKPQELLVEIRVPGPAPRTGGAFQEISRRHGDFALAAVAGTITLETDGSIAGASLVFSGSTPQTCGATEILAGKKPERALFEELATAASTRIEAESDIHASATYRKEIAKVLARRVLEEAAARARQQSF
jgi:CO/xanthine dehydrogenase FAD-binding subunit